MKAYPFDYIFIETVGVGQSEVEIAGLADTTVVVLVPEAGDSIQTMKAGLMEIADIFVVNKSDRAESEAMLNALSMQLHINNREHIPVLKTVAVEGRGVKELIEAFSMVKVAPINEERKIMLLKDKAIKIIQRNKMKGFDRNSLLENLKSAYQKKGFNLYRFTKKYLHGSGL
jgi:LAO/AO transport system kinase